jgi:putative ABC transport system permease protein
MWRDLAQTVRSWLRRPAFLALAVLTVALGVGANTALFSVLDAVLLRPFPYPEPERLVALRSNQSVLELDDIRAASASVESIGGITPMGLDLVTSGEPRRVNAGLVDAGLFDVLGAVPERGRLFTRAEDVVGGPPLVVLSHAFWKQLGGSGDLVGRTLSLSGRGYTVIGVMPPGFAAPRLAPDLWVSVRVAYEVAAVHRGVHFLRTYARLRSGASRAALQAEMEALDARLAAEYPGESRARHSVVTPLREQVTGGARPTLLLLFGAVSLVLLVAGANLANLLLARAVQRTAETTIRSALGAGRWRLMRPLLVEGACLSLLGGAAGVVLAWWGVPALLALAPTTLPRADTVRVDLGVLGYGLAVALVIGVVFAAAPAWLASHTDLAAALRERGRSVLPGRRRLPRALIAAEVALSVVLLVGAGLLLRTLAALSRVDPGFETHGVVTARLELPESRYPAIPAQTAYRDQVVAALSALPGVEAALVSEPPLSGQWLTHNLGIEGVSVAEGDEPETVARSVSGDYFGTMRIPVLRGRALGAADRAETAPVVVVNEAFVRERLGGREAVGTRICWARAEPRVWMTIVGVVGDVRHFGLEAGDEPAVYMPYSQSRQPWKRWQYAVVRGVSGSLPQVAEVKRAIWSVDPAIPITDVRTEEELASAATAGQRFQAVLLGIFGGLAMVLAAAGIFGVASQTVASRTGEVGIRLALGARPGRAAGQVVWDVVRACLFGAAAGLVASLAAARLLRATLFGVSPADPVTLAVVALTAVSAAVIASGLPALRAASVDPMQALRYE